MPPIHPQLMPSGPCTAADARAVPRLSLHQAEPASSGVRGATLSTGVREALRPRDVSMLQGTARQGGIVSASSQ